MLSFDSDNPFPLLPPESHSYLDAQNHSAVVDQWLGLEIEKSEALISKNSKLADRQHWIGLPSQALLTPYTELRSILNQLTPQTGNSVVDLGAGYGRLGHVIGRHYPDVRFIGYECVEERYLEARRCLARWQYARVEMILADLNAPDFKPELSDFYFIYDFGEREAIEKTLQDLRRIAQKQTITVVGRGRSSRDAIERQHPWLSDVVKPRHYGHHSIYRSA